MQSAINSHEFNVVKSTTKTCTQCGKTFANRNTLHVHRKNVHGKEWLPGVTRTKQICAEDGCNELVVQTAAELRAHLVEAHGYEINLLEKSFESEREFECWKAELEEQTTSRFTQNGKCDGVSELRAYYYCNRSGRFNSTAKVRRAKDSCKTGIACTAFIKAKLFKDTGRVQVTYTPHHYRHEKQLRYGRIPLDLRIDVARKLKAQMTAKDILAEYRNAVSGDSRACLLTRKSIRNIARSFGLRVACQKKDDPLKPQEHQQQHQQAVRSILSDDVPQLLEVTEKRKKTSKTIRDIGALMDDINFQVIALGHKKSFAPKLAECLEMLRNVREFLKFGSSLSSSVNGKRPGSETKNTVCHQEKLQNGRAEKIVQQHGKNHSSGIETSSEREKQNKKNNMVVSQQETRRRMETKTVFRQQRSCRQTRTVTNTHSAKLGKPKVNDKMDFLADLFGEATEESMDDHNYTVVPTVIHSLEARPAQKVVRPCELMQNSKLAEMHDNQILMPAADSGVWTTIPNNENTSSLVNSPCQQQHVASTVRFQVEFSGPSQQLQPCQQHLLLQQHHRPFQLQQQPFQQHWH